MDTSTRLDCLLPAELTGVMSNQLHVVTHTRPLNAKMSKGVTSGSSHYVMLIYFPTE